MTRSPPGANFLHSGCRQRAAAAPRAPPHPARCARAARRVRAAGPRDVGPHGSRASPRGARSGGTRRGRQTPPARSPRPPRARSLQGARSGCLERAGAKRSVQKGVARSLAPRCAWHPCDRHPRPQHCCQPGEHRASPGFRIDVRQARRCPASAWTRRLGWKLPRTSAEPLPPPHPAMPPVYEASPPGTQAARWAS